jgi:hypothetical protein
MLPFRRKRTLLETKEPFKSQRRQYANLSDLSMPRRAVSNHGSQPFCGTGTGSVPMQHYRRVGLEGLSRIPRSTASYCTSDMLSVTKSLLSQRRILVRMSRRGKALHRWLIDRCYHWMLWLQWLLDDSKVVGSTTPSNL